ncbi:transglycosylase domain-containing protein [Klugiella xanthotipulae]|nr:transglycosylase domain-containing protein [Klugiella xanthotipulae]
MTGLGSSSKRAQKGGARPVTPRTFNSAVGGVLGVVAMSAVAGVLVSASVLPVVAVTSSATDTAISVFDNLPEILKIEDLAQPSNLYAKQGDENVRIATFYVQDRVEVGWDEISQYAKDAAIATEDPRFYEHGGVDMISMSRAMLTNTFSSAQTSGASTITMQYVKNVLVQEAEAKLNKEERDAAYDEATSQTPDRKLKEMKLAVEVEKKYSKDQILQGYLNIALFGRTIYGIEAAASYYFNVSAKDLTLPQAASLIATVNNPAKLQIDKAENIPANKGRRDMILGDMLKHTKITQAEYDEAIATEVVPDIHVKQSGCSVAGPLAFFCDYVSRAIRHDESFGNTPEERWFKFRRGGLNIYTSIDLDVQGAAQTAMAANVAAQMEGIDVGSAAITVENGTGRILAMTQNKPYNDDPEVLNANPGAYTAVNYNTDVDYGGSSGFQVGSTYKAFTLAEWIRTGHSVRDSVDTTPGAVNQAQFKASCKPGGVADYGSFKFDNATRAKGVKTVLEATAQSINGGFVSMAKKMDLCDITKMATDLGVHRAAYNNAGTNKLVNNLSSVYGGTDEIAPLTMALAYSAFGSDGKVCEPNAIDSITNSAGKEVPFTKGSCRQGIEPRVAAGVAYALQYSVTNGLARSAALSSYGIPHFAKTGTTNNYWDNWVIGGSSKATTAIWVGNATGKVDTRRYPGLETSKNRMFRAIMDVADVKFGGEQFATADSKALNVKTTAVPDTTGLEFDKAQALLTNLGFTVADGGEDDSEQPAGMVARTDPAAGSALSDGSAVTIFRSNGSMKNIPAVSGTYKDAVQTLRTNGFATVQAQCDNTSDKVPANRNDRTVTGTSPAAGTAAKETNSVTIIIKCS